MNIRSCQFTNTHAPLPTNPQTPKVSFSDLTIKSLPLEDLELVISYLNVLEFSRFISTCKEFSNNLSPQRYLALVSPRINEMVRLNHGSFDFNPDWDEAIKQAGPKIQKLDLSITKNISLDKLDKMLKQNFPALKSLKIQNPDFRDIHLSVIASHPHLQELDLTETYTNQFATLAPILNSHKIKKLALKNFGNLDEIQVKPTHLPSLEELELELPKDTESHRILSSISNFTSLKKLTISSSFNLATYFRSFIHNLTQLQELTLKDAQYWPAEFSALSQAFSLTSLRVDLCHLTAGNIQSLIELNNSLPNLKNIELAVLIKKNHRHNDCKETINSSNLLASHPSIKKIHLLMSVRSYCDECLEDYFAKLAPLTKSYHGKYTKETPLNTFSKLEVLDLVDSTVDGTFSMPKLKKMCLRFSRISANFLNSMAQNMPPNLQLLSFRGSNVSDETLKPILEKGRLKMLDLRLTDIGDETIANIVSHQKNLKYLDVGQTHVTEKGIEALCQLTTLKGINCDDCFMKPTDKPKPQKAFERRMEFKMPSLGLMLTGEIT